MKSTDLSLTEVPPYYRRYIELVPDLSMVETLDRSLQEMLGCVRPLSEAQMTYRYAEGKWSIKDVLQHLMDAERIFSYRALRFARADETPLSSFDHDGYVPAAQADHRSLESLLAEYQALRASSLALFGSFTPEMLMRSGTASGSQISVRALGFMISGHELHHLQILKERYLS